MTPVLRLKQLAEPDSVLGIWDGAGSNRSVDKGRRHVNGRNFNSKVPGDTEPGPALEWLFHAWLMLGTWETRLVTGGGSDCFRSDAESLMKLPIGQISVFGARNPKSISRSRTKRALGRAVGRQAVKNGAYSSRYGVSISQRELKNFKVAVNQQVEKSDAFIAVVDRSRDQYLTQTNHAEFLM